MLEELKMNRTSLMDSMVRGSGWTDDHLRQLAEIQGAIAAVEAVIEEGPLRDEYQPGTKSKVEFGEDGWPKT
ncbi:hypothetical protein [Mesorhizobium sp. LjNodule214]|uniref:hypothetical protein n=1 Tax=Mesorhizobium sp. LjNodule214 TaxID=3342252 RepID=UPI003ECEDD8D